MSPVSPTLPASSARLPLSRPAAGFDVRRITNSCGIVPALRTANVTTPAGPTELERWTEYSASETSTWRAGAVGAAVTAPAPAPAHIIGRMTVGPEVRPAITAASVTI